MLGNIIGGFIVILVGTTLAPTVAQQVGTAQADGNVTGAADTILGLTTLFYCLSIATTSIGIAAQGNIFSCPLFEESINAQPEFRLKPSDGQDRSVNIDSSIYARTTDKGIQNGWIYSLDSNNNQI